MIGGIKCDKLCGKYVKNCNVNNVRRHATKTHEELTSKLNKNNKINKNHENLSFF